MLLDLTPYVGQTIRGSFYYDGVTIGAVPVQILTANATHASIRSGHTTYNIARWGKGWSYGRGDRVVFRPAKTA